MTFGPKRGHVMFIFERFFRDFGLLLIYVAAYLIIKDVQILLDNIFLAVVAFFMPVTRTVNYLTTYYTIDQEKLLIKSGLFNKRTQEIPLVNITSVDFTQSLILQLAKVYCIHVENASSLGSTEQGSVKIVLGAEDAVTVKRILLSKHENFQVYDVQAETPEACAAYTASLKDILLMGFLQVRVLGLLIQALAFIGVSAGFLASLIEAGRGTSAEKIIMEVIDNMGVALVITAIVVMYLISLIIGALISFIKFYGFRITDRGNSLFVEYGLITKKTHTVMKEKISGVVYVQSIFMRLLKKGSLSVFAAGYGVMDDDAKEETVLLYPVTDESEMYSFLEAVLPGFAEEPIYEKSPVRAIPYYFLCVRFIAAIILLAAAWLIPAGFVVIKQCAVVSAVILLITAIISVIMESRNSAVSAATKMIVMRTGGFRRTTTLLVRDKIEFAEDIGSNRKRARIGAATLKVGVLAPNQLSSCKVRNVRLEVSEAVRSRLLY